MDKAPKCIWREIQTILNFLSFQFFLAKQSKTLDMPIRWIPNFYRDQRNDISGYQKTRYWEDNLQNKLSANAEIWFSKPY